MHILIGVLIGLAVATALIIMWANGNLFACVFLSVPTSLAMLIFILQDRVRSPDATFWAVVCAGALAVIWAPHYCIRRRDARIHRSWSATPFIPP